MSSGARRKAALAGRWMPDSFVLWGGPQGNFYGKEKEEDNPIDGNISRGFLISYYEDPMRLVLWIDDVVLCRAA
jgi:hypothetical protein